MNKRGLSSIVIKLILILLAVIAIVIVWIAVRNVIFSGSEEINIGKFTTKINIEDVKFNPNSVDLKIKRYVGIGDVSGIKVVFFDGLTYETFEYNSEIKELEEKTITLNYDGLVKEVSIAPLFKTSSEQTITGGIVDKKKYSDIESVKNIPGLISWWKMDDKSPDGNVKDEVGIYNGTLRGSVNCSIQGKFGKACGFNGVDSYINVSSFPFSDFEGTIETWVWLPVTKPSIDGNILRIGSPSDFHSLRRDNNSKDINYFISNGGLVEYNVISNSKWYHIAATYNKSKLEAKLFFDGVIRGNSSNLQNTPSVYGNTLYIGAANDTSNFLNGTIDEMKIYNRALSDKEIRGLYNLDLN